MLKSVEKCETPILDVKIWDPQFSTFGPNETLIGISSLGAIHPLGHPTAPSGADGRSEARAETRKLRYLLNGLELVELMG